MANLQAYKFVSGLLFGAGVVVLAFTVARAREVLRKLGPATQPAAQWGRMLLLVRFFLAAYLGALGIVVLGRFEILSLVTGLVFALGAVYVWTSVNASAEASIALANKSGALKRAEQSLEEKQQQLQTFFDIAAVGFCQVDVRTLRFISANAKMEEITGYSLAELQELTFTDITHEDDRERDGAAYSDMLEGRSPVYSIEKRYVRKNGEIVWVLVTSVVARDALGSRSVAVVHDISEQVRLRTELEKRVDERTAEIGRSYAFVNAVLENIPDAVFVKEARELRVTRVNKAWEELFGFPQEGLVGKNDYDLFPASEADGFTSMDRKVLTSGKMLDIDEESVHTRLKGERLLHTKKVPIFGDGGEPEYLLGIAEDITERKQTEEVRDRLLKETIAHAESERQLRLRDEFISIAAHELKTPLTALRMQVQLLGRLLPQIESNTALRLKALMDGAQSHLGRFSTLVDDLLDVSRASEGRLTLVRKSENLATLVRRVAARYDSELTRVQCRLTLDLDPSIVGYWDSGRLDQLLVNLLANAMKYGAGKPIEISAQANDRWAKLVVRDKGRGIALEDQARIFERFERAVSSASFGGLGLGLYIARQIAVAHGGWITVESELGKGATFTVALPLGPRDS